MDSSFSLTPVPLLSGKPIRLLEIKLKVPSWDTARMRLNLMVLQVHHSDTTYSILPLPMQVRNNSLRYKFPGNGLAMQADSFYIGYSLAAFYVPEYFCFRMFAKESPLAAAARIHGGRLNMNLLNAMLYLIPFELRYEEI